MSQNLTVERLREVLSYDPDTGIFRRKLATAQRLSVGDIAGSKNDQGYLLIMVDRVRYKAHRLAWFYVNDEWPPHDVDHINGIRDDNRLANLRLATRAQNKANQVTYKNNSTGFKGVSFHKKNRCFVSYINRDKVRRYLGSFPSAEDAHAAYCSAATEVHGEFTRTPTTQQIDTR